jgi:capsular exopolysaccharide synthesis family protein
MQRGAGLADALQGKVEIKDVIRPSQVNNLWMISSGHVPATPSELMGSDRMRQIVARLGQMFDLVVCDAPSLHVVTDPVLLATHIDTVILVVAVGRTRRDTIVRAKKFLEVANPHIAGVVLNGLESSRRHYYYYYYYYQDEKASA